MKAGVIWNDRVMRGKCIICDSATREILHKKYDLKYHYCDMCGFISKDAANRISTEDELKIYRKHNNSIYDPRYVTYFKDFIDAAVIDFRGTGMTVEELKSFLYEKAKVGFEDGSIFGIEGEGFMRVNLACPRALVEEAMKRLINAWKS